MAQRSSSSFSLGSSMDVPRRGSMASLNSSAVQGSASLSGSAASGAAAPASGASALVLSNLKMSARLAAGYVGARIDGEAVGDELEAYTRLVTAASIRAVKGLAPAGDAVTYDFSNNDAMQVSLETAAADFNGPTRESRQAILRKVITSHTDAAVALGRNDRTVLKEKGWLADRNDPKSMTFVLPSEGLLLHQWSSRRHARRWVTRSSRVIQTILEHRLSPLCAPCTLLLSTRGLTYTFTFLTPLPDATLSSDAGGVDGVHQAELDRAAAAIGGLLGTSGMPDPDDFASMQAVGSEAVACNPTAKELDLRVGTDGRIYCMAPCTLGIDVVRGAISGSFAADATSDCPATFNPEAYHVACPSGLTAGPSLKVMLTGVTTVALEHAVQGLIRRAAELGKANGGTVKIMDALQGDLVSGTLKQHGVNRCFLHLMYEKLKANSTPFAAMLSEIVEAEMIARALKSVMRSEAQVATDRSDAGLLKAFTTVYALYVAGDQHLLDALNVIVRKKFDIRGSYTVVQGNPKLQKLVLYFVNAALSCTFDSQANKFNKFGVAPPASAAPTHPELTRLASKVPEGAAALFQLQCNAWTKMPDSLEKWQRLSRLALLGFWTKHFRVDAVFEALATSSACKWQYDPTTVFEQGPVAFGLSQLTGPPRPAVHLAQTSMKAALDAASDRPLESLAMAWHLRNAQRLGGYAALFAIRGVDLRTCPTTASALNNHIALQRPSDVSPTPLVQLLVAIVHAASSEGDVSSATCAAMRAVVKLATDAVVEGALQHDMRIELVALPPCLAPHVSSASTDHTALSLFTAVARHLHATAVAAAGDVPNDPETVTAAIRVALGSVTSLGSRHASGLALLEYMGLVGDGYSSKIASHDALASWSQTYYGAPQISEITETVQTKSFAACIGSLCSEVLIPAGRWSDANLIARAIGRHTNFFVAASQTPKFTDALQRLEKCDAAATTIQRHLMPIVAQRSTNSAMQQRWPKKSAGSASVASPDALERMSAVYVAGLRIMESVAWNTTVVKGLVPLAEAAVESVQSEEDAAWSRLTSEFAALAGAAASASVVDDELSARAALVEHASAAQFALVEEYLLEGAQVAFSDAFNSAVQAVSAFAAASAASSEIGACRSEETTNRGAVEQERADAFVVLELSELEARAVLRLQDNFDECSRLIADAAASIGSAAAIAKLESEEVEARDGIAAEVATASLELHADAARFHLVVAESSATVQLTSDALLEQYSCEQQEHMKALRQIVTQATAGASSLALDVIQDHEAAIRSSISAEMDANAQALIQHEEAFTRAAIDTVCTAATAELLASVKIEQDVCRPEITRRRDLVTASLEAKRAIVEGVAYAVVTSVAAEAQRGVLTLVVEQEAEQRVLNQHLSFDGIARALLEAADEMLTRDVRTDEAKRFATLASKCLVNRRALLQSEAELEMRRLVSDGFVGLHQHALEEAEADLTKLRAELHQRGIKKLIKLTQGTLEPQARAQLQAKYTTAAMNMLVSVHKSFRHACIRDATGIRIGMLTRMEQREREIWTKKAFGRWRLELAVELEENLRSSMVRLERKLRRNQERQTRLFVDEARSRRAIESQAEKVYEDVDRVLDILMRAMVAGPRASLMKPSERMLLMRKEEATRAKDKDKDASNPGSPQRAAGETSPTLSSPETSPTKGGASPDPRVSLSQRGVPLEAVVIHDPVLLQQAAILENLASMRMEETTTHALAEASRLHKRWAASPYDDQQHHRGPLGISFVEVEDTEVRRPLSPQSFLNVTTSIFAQEAWKRQQIIHVHAEFISSCRIEMREVDTLMRGERCPIPRTTLLFDLPLVSPLYFTCFKELSRRMTKTPEQRARARSSSSSSGRKKTQLRAENLPGAASKQRGGGAGAGRRRLPSIASSMSSMSLNPAHTFEGHRKTITHLKKVMIACDRGVSALYVEEDRTFVKLAAQERFGRVAIEAQSSLVTEAQEARSSVLREDPTATPALALPKVPMPTRDAVALHEAEHRMKVAMAEAEHRFEMLQRLTRELPRARGHSLYHGTGPLPHYLDQRFITKVARNRPRPKALEMSPRRMLSGSPPAGSGGYSFAQSPSASHSPERAPRRRLAPVSRSASSLAVSASDPFKSPGASEAFSAATPEPRKRQGSLPPLNES